MTLPYIVGRLLSVDKIGKASIALCYPEQDFNFYIFTINIAHYMESTSIPFYGKLTKPWRGRKGAFIFVLLSLLCLE